MQSASEISAGREPATLTGILRKPKLRGTIPFLACIDIGEALRYYETVLGFRRDWVWGDPVSDAGVSRDGVRLYLGWDMDLARRVAGSEIVVLVDGLDELHVEHRMRGAEITSPLQGKPWGTREYSVVDLNGYTLRFTEDADAE